MCQKHGDFYRQNGIRYRGGLPDHDVRVPKLQSFPDRRFHPVGEEKNTSKKAWGENSATDGVQRVHDSTTAEK